MENIHIWGEDTESSNPDNPYCAERHGHWFASGLASYKDLHPLSASALPVYKMKSAGTWASYNELKGITFHDFDSTTIQGCSSKQYTMGLNPGASDHVHEQIFKDIVFDNVHEDAMLNIYDPPTSWANPTDCGNFPCTAPQNVVLRFTGTTYTGSTVPSFTDADF